MNELTETILHVVVGIIIAFSLIYVAGVLLHTSIPVVAVESNSMVPTFSKGDILIIQGILKEELKVSDIIVFAVPGQSIPVVHRIIKINSDGTFQTQGDANNGQLDFEKSINHDQIYGKMVFMIPFLGWVKIGLVQYVLPNIFIVIVLIAIIAFIYFIKQDR
jgi:signal peptidase I